MTEKFKQSSAKEMLTEACEANDWDFERVANSMGYLSPHQIEAQLVDQRIIGHGEGQEHALADIKENVFISAATEQRIRMHLWLGHGHTGQYGDDGEMQCAACIPFGACDYKRASLEDLLETHAAIGVASLLALAGKEKS